MRAALANALFVLASLASLVGCGGGADPARAPHIVLLVADDLGRGDVGFESPGTVDFTPSIDALASQSLVLSRFYTAPICTPTRAALLTGRDPVALGMLGNLRPVDEDGLPSGEVTLAERLRSAGYATHLVGKWHLGHTTAAQHPGARGFDHFYGHLGGFIDYYTHTRDGELDWQRDGEPLIEEGYATRLLAREAVRVLAEHDAERPLLLVVTFNAPHIPLQWPPGMEGERVAAAGAERACYEAMVAELDDAVGAIVGAIDARGMADDTLLVFASDNGASTAHGGDNGDLRYGKYGTYEGGVRAPCAVRWPGRLAPGRDSTLVTAYDLGVSLACAGGAPPDAGEGLDGRDVLGALARGERLAPRPIGFGLRRRDRNRYGLIDWPWKLVQIVHREDGRIENGLFDIERDPGETEDLADREPEQLARLVAALDAWKERHPGPIPGEPR